MTDWIFSFVDFLGYADKVKKIKNETELSIIKDEISDFVTNFSADGELNNDYKSSEEIKTGEVIVKSFSDCIIRAVKLSDKSEERGIQVNVEIESLAKSIIWSIQKGYLVRGAVSIGQHFEGLHTSKGNDQIPYIISPALIKSYYLESKVAIYPRFLIDHEVSTILNKGNKKLLYTYRDWNSLNYLVHHFIDENDIYSERYEEHKNLIENGLKKHRNQPEIMKKFRWLKSFHNRSLNQIFSLAKYEMDDLSNDSKECMSFI